MTLTLDSMAHGGAAIGRDEKDRVIFVPYAIPGERVRVEVVEDKGRYAHASLLEVLEASPDRVAPRCPHFGFCGDSHYQHIDYAAQLRFKQAIVADQLNRIGGLADVVVRPVIANPEPWAYRVDVSLSPALEGKLGLWSPTLDRVMPIETCAIIRPQLLELMQDLDLELEGLRKLTLRVGDDEALLVALEIEDVEPPELETDFPVSVAIVLPDGTAANLIGDNYVVHSVKGRDFRVSAGVFFHPSPPGAAFVVDAVLNYAALTGTETILEAYSGVGVLTAFLSPAAAGVIAIERNPDAVADAAVNLDEAENVSLYEGAVEEILPALDVVADVMVVDPPETGLSRAALAAVVQKAPARLIYASSDPATLARDGRQLAAAGYRLVEVQPIDMFPQTFQIQTVSLWYR